MFGPSGASGLKSRAAPACVAMAPRHLSPRGLVCRSKSALERVAGSKRSHATRFLVVAMCQVRLCETL